MKSDKLMYGIFVDIYSIHLAINPETGIRRVYIYFMTQI